MAAPVFQALGALSSGTAAITVAWPVHAINDIALLVVESANEAISLSTPAGFVEVTGSPQGTGTAAAVTATRLAVFWCRATSTTMASPVVADPGDHAEAYIITFRGCKTSGNPWNTTAGDVLAAASTACTIPGGTTSVAECLVVAIVATGSDVATGRASAWANASLVSITERADLYDSTASNGGGISVAEGVKLVAGAYSASTCTLSTSFVQGRLSVALEPASANTLIPAGLGALVVTGFAAALKYAVNVGLAALSLSGFAPTVAVSNNIVVTPGVSAPVFAGQSPAVVIGAATVIQPGTASVTFSGQAPTLLVTVTIPTGLGQPVVTGLAPTALVSNNITVLPGLGTPVFAGIAPNVVASISASPGFGQVSFGGLAPSAVLSNNQIATAGLGQVTFAGLSPTVTVASSASLAKPGTGQFAFAGFAPNVIQPLRPAIAVSRGTTPIRTASTGSISLGRKAGVSVMDTYTTDNALLTTDDTRHRTDQAPMGS